MKQAASRFTAYIEVLRPTASGTILYVLIALIALFIHKVPSFQQYLNVPTSWHIGSAFLVLLNELLLKLVGTNRIDTVVLSIFWVGVGMVVYLFLKTAIAFFVEMGEDITESSHYVQPAHSEPKSELNRLVTLGFFRLVVLILTIFYIAWMVSFLSHGPSASVAIFGHWSTSSTVACDMFFFIFAVLAWYLFSLLLRLITMRNRLFG